MDYEGKSSIVRKGIVDLKPILLKGNIKIYFLQHVFLLVGEKLLTLQSSVSILLSRLIVNLIHFVLFWASYLFSSLCFSIAGMRTAVNGHVTISTFSGGSVHGSSLNKSAPILKKEEITIS